MATMVKEKPREKKKSKTKHVSHSSVKEEQALLSNDSDTVISSELHHTVENIVDNAEQDPGIPRDLSTFSEQVARTIITTMPLVTETSSSTSNIISSDIKNLEKSSTVSTNPSLEENLQLSKDAQCQEDIGSNYEALNSRLERVQIPRTDPNFRVEEIKKNLEHAQAYVRPPEEETGQQLRNEHNKEEYIQVGQNPEEIQNVIPSAPIFEEQGLSQVFQQIEVVKEVTPKTQCLPLEEAIRLYGAREMAEIRAMSEREEAVVEAGPLSGPEHPLVDLLSTFRSSLIAVERERVTLARGFSEEEKFRSTLWKIEKRNITVSEKCACGSVVDVRASYEHAELLKEKIPVAKLKLEALLRDVQESYCHHQHAALLAHCQIEELISETMKSSKPEIREALALVMQALRMSDTAPAALAAALQRWAAALATALLDARDLRQLLHFLHHLFRQSRSVQWAARIMRGYIDARDRSSAAQAMALLDLILSGPCLETATECVEDVESEWEEVDEKGAGGAVSEGALRERDLLALLHAFPTRQLIATIVHLTHTDLKEGRESALGWGDSRAVLDACLGTRCLVRVCARGVSSRAHYSRMRTALRALVAHAAHTLQALHLNTRHSYSNEMEGRISAELEAVFTEAVVLFNGQDLNQLPATLLADDTAGDYCTTIINGLHDKSSTRIESLSIELPELPCGTRVELVAQAAFDRTHDNELARLVLDFLLQTGISKKPSVCGGGGGGGGVGGCAAAARAALPRLLAKHPYLHTIAIHMLAELYTGEPFEAKCLDAVSIETWRPTPGETRLTLAHWAARCPDALPNLLARVHCSPPLGVSLESQLAIGSWLCERQWPPTGAPEWAWTVLRALRVHRTSWRIHLDAPPPDKEPHDLLSSAFAVLSSSWGHSVPLICSEGVSALCLVATSRPADAVHCLAPIMLVMAHSPESISLTPRFTDLFNILLKSGPTIVQRAFGLGPQSGADLLTRLALAQVEDENGSVPRPWVVSAWLHGLWRPTLPAGACLEPALLSARDWTLYDTYAAQLLKESNGIEYITTAVQNCHSAPLLCEIILRAAHDTELRSLWPRLLDMLHLQRVNAHRIHVDNAITQLGVTMNADFLVIYRCANAVLSAPCHHPSHLMLWRLLFHLYLQRPPTNMSETTPPVGPLFFSGIIKSRLLAKLRKKLQDTISYHRAEAENYKQKIPKNQSPQRPPRNKTEINISKSDDDVLPMLTLHDLTGETSESSESESSESEDERGQSEKEDSEVTVSKQDDELLIKYHLAAENMCSEFLKWFDEGDKIRATPHHADIARFIPEQALSAAWSLEVSRRRPAPPPALAPPRAPTHRHNTPFEDTVARLRTIKDKSLRRSRKEYMKSPIENADLRDARTLIALVEKHLADIEALAHEWTSEVTRISSLDSALWDLVTSLRVRRPLPSVKKSCPQRCKPVTVHIPHDEWCISTGAERGIQENRRSARSLVRRVCRPRPHAARTAAALDTLARGVCSRAAGLLAAERAWRAARAPGCPPAATAIQRFVLLLADKWICSDGKICGELLSRWSQKGSELQQSLCGALVQPNRLPPADPHWTHLYCALLKTTLPPHAVFSYLSKFDLKTLATNLDPLQRRSLLEALAAAAQKWGPTPAGEYHVLLELIGVHTLTLLNPQELSAHIDRCSRASVAGVLPPSYYVPVIKAAEIHAMNIPFDQLGHTLRSLGVCWWGVRSGAPPGLRPAPARYAGYVADLLHVLQRSFVASALALSYAPERVALYAWYGLLDSWSPWVSPHAAAPPLLPSSGGDELYTHMLRRFADNIHQIILDCPGTEERLLQLIFEWSVQTYLSVPSGAPQECRVQLSALLEALRSLPWTEHQWWDSSCIKTALQVCNSNDREIESWCSAAWRDLSAEGWLRGAGDELLPAVLANLLYIFTAISHHAKTIDESARLPWSRLPLAALEPALDRFFAQYHSPAQPYHELPQFRVLLYASELSVEGRRVPASPDSRDKRCACVMSCVRAASQPALAAHVPAHTAAMLRTLELLAPCIEESQGEIEELLSRAIVILCVDPAAAAALPVWERWVSTTSPRLSRASLSAVSVLTSFENFAVLADTAAKAHLQHKDSSGWSEVLARWSSCPWWGGGGAGAGAGVGALCARARLHAAYAGACLQPTDYDVLRPALVALTSATINYIENEVVMGVWMCLACRVAVECGGVVAGAGAECGAAARGLVARGAEHSRSLLRAVVRQEDPRQPTHRHRLLCRLALCIISNTEATVKAYEESCASLLSGDPDVLAWGKAPKLSHLIRMAVRLFPTAEVYFKHEQECIPKD